VPLRALVHVDVIRFKVPEKVSFLKFFTRTVETEVMDKLLLSLLWHYSSKTGVILELFDTGISQEEMDEFLERLDGQQAHPFRSGSVYPNLTALVSELPYRQDILGIIDLPERGLRYGSRWIDLTQIA
jgi:hypothetical protein